MRKLKDSKEVECSGFIREPSEEYHMGKTEEKNVGCVEKSEVPL
jgi:hypothetical protein